MPVPVIMPPLPSVGEDAGSGASALRSGDAAGFGATLQQALVDVSHSQEAATAAENAVAAGKPGASISTALVLSDRAEVGWNAVVAVRNEVVSAYQTMMNMQI